MSAHQHGPSVVRIIELPPLRMARSGRSDLGAFETWWSALSGQDKSSLFPRDFMWFNPLLDSFEWLYALPDGVTDSGGYEVLDFPGGLYAVAACKDDGPDIEETNRFLHAWIAESEVFSAPPPEEPRYDMGHVITPLDAKERMGYHQMDVFVPVVYRDRRA